MVLLTFVVDGVDHHSVAYHAVVPALTWVGRRSYSLYLWQQLFLNPYHNTLLQRFPINIGLAVLCAAVSYQFIELPFNTLRRHFRRVPPLDMPPRPWRETSREA